MIRDNALAVSGLLAERVGGPSVRPYQPEGYYAPLNFPRREYVEAQGPDLYRRGVYTHWQRTFLHPGLLAFDAPSREECTVSRVPSNTPLQALVLLNDETYVEAARVFAGAMVQRGGRRPEEGLDWGFRHALARPPTAGERAVLLPFLEEQRARFRSSPELAGQLIAVGRAPGTGQGWKLKQEAAEVAAWTSVARSLLNLHEAVTRN